MDLWFINLVSASSCYEIMPHSAWVHGNCGGYRLPNSYVTNDNDNNKFIEIIAIFGRFALWMQSPDHLVNGTDDYSLGLASSRRPPIATFRFKKIHEYAIRIWFAYAHTHTHRFVFSELKRRQRRTVDCVRDMNASSISLAKLDKQIWYVCYLSLQFFA